MALTKSTEEVDAWAEIAQAGVRDGANVDLPDPYPAVLFIECALSSTTAHTGTKIVVQIGTDTGNANDNWTTLVEFVGVVGTAISTVLAATEPIGETVLAITNPVTNNQDNDKKFKFIENIVAADSEIVYAVANSGDAGDTVTILNGLSHEQDVSTSIMYDIDDANAEVISPHAISIPPSADRVRVIYNNNFDPDGSTVFTRARITKVVHV